MSPPLYIVLGRADDCDFVLDDRSVSSRHARLSWRGRRILVEDLGSANGTFVDGERVERVEVRPGVELTLGDASFPWSDPRLKPFLRRGASGDTQLGMRIPGRRFICGSCGARGLMPEGFKWGKIRCGACGVTLQVGKRSRRGLWLTLAAASVFSIAALVVGWALWDGAPGSSLQRAAEQLGLSDPYRGQPPPTSPQERAIRRRIAPLVVEAMDSTHPTTRNTAVRLASEDQGPFRLEQVARIWTHVRARWRYVNDPRGDEFFAKASETIENEFAGDCDDFATVLAAMIEAIGGEARVIMVDGDQGGHAYAEACIHETADDVAARLATHYRNNWDRYLGPRERVTSVHFRTSESCPLWLNLDWNARVPGGPYGHEYWAVAIYSDGRTETLAPSLGASVDGQASGGTLPNAATPSSP